MYDVGFTVQHARTLLCYTDGIWRKKIIQKLLILYPNVDVISQT